MGQRNISLFDVIKKLHLREYASETELAADVALLINSEAVDIENWIRIPKRSIGRLLIGEQLGALVLHWSFRIN